MIPFSIRNGSAKNLVTTLEWTILTAAVFTVAFFHPSIGHGDATGCLSALAFLGISPASTKGAVLFANIFAAAAIPLAYLGGKIPVSPPGLQNHPGHGAVVGRDSFFAALALAGRRCRHAG